VEREILHLVGTNDFFLKATIYNSNWQ